MMETIDYKNNTIHFNGISFPFVIIKEGDDEHIISVIDLQKQLFDEDGNYVSDKAEWLDEQITYFVENEEDLQRSAKDILDEIYG